MSTKEAGQVAVNPTNIIQLKLSSLIGLCVCLVTASAVTTTLLMFGLLKFNQPHEGLAFGQPPPLPATRSDTNPPWGELIKFDLEVEQPDEYVAFEPVSNRVTRWVFPDQTPAQVRTSLQTAGFNAKQIESALTPSAVTTAPDATLITPNSELIHSLTAEVRKNLYTELAHTDRNRYMRFPYCFMTNHAEEFFAKSGVAPEVISHVAKLTYERYGNYYFSDVETVLNQIPTSEARLHFFKTLSRSSVVMARLRVRPNTDIEKLIGYWAGNKLVRQKDLKPLLESLKRCDEGGTVSVMYLLPPFARERLFTTPFPSSPGDPSMDCHWSAMNFFNSEPDFRFSDLTYTAAYVKTNYYPVAQPTAYGDIVFLLDPSGNAIHSAVYIADDIVFTKNGNNYAQPWVLMRLPNLIGLYSVTDTPRIACYRHKNS
ncbi:MAG: hypothetical protein QM813_04805 [Verrucomicrobiota bacterium]